MNNLYNSPQTFDLIKSRTTQKRRRKLRFEEFNNTTHKYDIPDDDTDNDYFYSNSNNEYNQYKNNRSIDYHYDDDDDGDDFFEFSIDSKTTSKRDRRSNSNQANKRLSYKTSPPSLSFSFDHTPHTYQFSDRFSRSSRSGRGGDRRSRYEEVIGNTRDINYESSGIRRLFDDDDDDDDDNSNNNNNDSGYYNKNYDSDDDFFLKDAAIYDEQELLEENGDRDGQMFSFSTRVSPSVSPRSRPITTLLHPPNRGASTPMSMKNSSHLGNNEDKVFSSEKIDINNSPASPFLPSRTYNFQPSLSSRKMKNIIKSRSLRDSRRFYDSYEDEINGSNSISNYNKEEKEEQNSKHVDTYSYNIYEKDDKIRTFGNGLDGIASSTCTCIAYTRHGYCRGHNIRPYLRYEYEKPLNVTSPGKGSQLYE